MKSKNNRYRKIRQALRDIEDLNLHINALNGAIQILLSDIEKLKKELADLRGQQSEGENWK
jgi:hypothetical protein